MQAGDKKTDEQSRGAIERVVIVGGGTAGWMTAAALAKSLPSQVRITLVESSEIGTVGVGEATIPSIRTFNDILGVDESEFLRETKATFKLGIEFVGWNKPDDVYFHPFGEHGRHTDEFRFPQLWYRLRHEASQGRCPDPGPISDYNICSVAAGLGRFDTDMSVQNAVAPLRYAYHLDASLYAAFLRRYAEARGVVRIEGRIEACRRRELDGFISEVVFTDGRSVGGDLFIDCSGFRGLLIHEELKAGFDDWSDLLPCDRAVAIGSELTGELFPFTRASADTAGWRWRIPLQHRTGNGYVFSSRHISADEATARLLSQLEGKPIGDPRVISFNTGLRDKMWVKNCVAVGLAAGFIEPLESTSIHLIQTAIAKILIFFPDKQFAQADIDAFNRATREEYEAVRDFIILHYCATERADSAFWNERRVMPLPVKLESRIDLFRSKGRIFRHQVELFADDSWLAVMMGQGIVPRGYDPLVDKIPLAQLSQNVAALRHVTAQAVSAMPKHQTYLMRHQRVDLPNGS